LENNVIPWRERVRRLVRGIPLGHHLPPLAVLALLHVAVLARTLRGADGIPERVIPWDFPISYARFLVFISDSLRAGVLPIWFPYGHAGMPFFVNPQTELWSPVTWLVSLFGGYDLLVAQQQLMLTLLAGSFGLYALAYVLWKNRWAALLAAIAYNFTSARLCNAEHMDFINAFSIFPWVFWATERVAQGVRYARPLLGIALAMLVVSGYPGVVLLSPLWFGAWAVWLLVTECPDGAARRQFLWGLALALGTGVLLSAGYWLPIAAHLEVFARSTPLTVDSALAQSLILPDLLHLVFGAPTTLVPEGAPADISMRGLYFGILAFALALLACLHRRDRRTAALGIGMVAALLMTLGSGSSFRVALHDTFPIFNLSRFPAGDSRAVAVLAGTLLAGSGLLAVRDDPEARRRFTRLLLALAVILIAGLLWLREAIFPSTGVIPFARQFSAATVGELFVVGLALVCLLRGPRPGVLVACLLVVAAIDSSTHASAESFFYSRPPQEVGAALDEKIHVRTFDVTNAELPRVDNPNIGATSSTEAYLNKKFYLPSHAGFRLTKLDGLLAAGFRPFLVEGKRVVGFPSVSPSAVGIPKVGATFQQQAQPVNFVISRYHPDRVDYSVDLTKPTTLVFNEMYFSGWKARIDQGPKVPMVEVAGGLRALSVPAGFHRIETRFSPGVFWIGLAITATAWLGVLAWLGLAIRSGRARARRQAPAV
jgi:hypothetical protein